MRISNTNHQNIKQTRFKSPMPSKPLKVFSNNCIDVRSNITNKITTLKPLGDICNTNIDKTKLGEINFKALHHNSVTTPVASNDDSDIFLDVHSITHQTRAYAPDYHTEFNNLLNDDLFRSSGTDGALNTIIRKNDNGHALSNVGINEPKQFMLHEACREGDLSTASYLVKNQHFDINMPNENGQTALHVASANGKTEIVQMLLSQKEIDVSTLDRLNETVLHEACFLGYEKIVELLITKINVKLLFQQNSAGFTPLKSACLGNQPNIVKLFLDQMNHLDRVYNALNIGENLFAFVDTCRYPKIMEELLKFAYKNIDRYAKRSVHPLTYAKKYNITEIIALSKSNPAPQSCRDEPSL